MANFITNKVTGQTVSAPEWNQLNEINNILLTAGITPSDAVTTQLANAVARYSAGSTFYTDSGSANTYILTSSNGFSTPVLSGAGYFNGMQVRFRAGFTNTGASTVNINSFGSKSITKHNFTALTGGEINNNADVILRYCANNDCFVLNVNTATKTNYGISRIVNSPIVFGLNSTDPNNDVDFFSNSFYFDDGSGSATLTSNLTKRLDANWVAGNNQGGLDTGTKSVNTWYCAHAIYNPTTNVADIIFTVANPGIPTLPSGFTKKRRIKGAFFLTNASANIRGFLYFPDGGQYIWGSPITVHSSQNTSGTANIDVAVPPLYGMVAYVQVIGVNDAVNAFSYTTIFSFGGTIYSGNTSNGESVNNGELPIFSNTSTAYITWGGNAARRNFIYTLGFIDTTNY
jgi:hypothetical protein